MSLLLLNVTLRGVSNKHCLLSLFSLTLTQIVWISLSRVLILLKCHHFGISRFNREI